MSRESNSHPKRTASLSSTGSIPSSKRYKGSGEPTVSRRNTHNGAKTGSNDSVPGQLPAKGGMDSKSDHEREPFSQLTNKMPSRTQRKVPTSTERKPYQTGDIPPSQSNKASGLDNLEEGLPPKKVCGQDQASIKDQSSPSEDESSGTDSSLSSYSAESPKFELAVQESEPAAAKCTTAGN